MNKFKYSPWRKTISLLLSIAVIFTCFTSCGSKKSSSSTSVEENNDNTESSGVNFTLPYEDNTAWITDFPNVTHWEGDVEMPYFNPLGEKDKYTQVQFEKNLNTKWEWVDKDNRLKSSQICGDTWKLKASGYTSQEDFLFLMDSYCVYKGMDFYGRVAEDERMFSINDANNVTWWALVKVGKKEASFTIIREFRLIAGVPVTLNTSDLSRKYFWFNTYRVENSYMNLSIELDGGNISLLARQNSQYDSYSRNGSYNKILDTREGNIFILNDIPQDSGAWNWKLTWNEKSGPETVTLTLNSHAGLSDVTQNDQLGAIRVKNANYGQVTVQPYLDNVNTLSHPEYDKQSLRGDTTPDGDVIFWLPAGYWDVIVTTKTNNTDYLRSGMIPVTSGRETIVTLPAAMQTAYTDPGKSPETDKGMEILYSEDKGNTAEVVFTLSDKETSHIEPIVSNTFITEGGAEGSLLSLERLKTPPNIVLLLDSSGSMRGQMEKTLEAAKAFITGLPEDTIIQLVDFDTKQTLIEGTTKEAALQGLKTIKANGATSLNDSILLGIDLLKGKDRPTLIVFTDGMDANNDDTGPGSKATAQQVFEGVEQAGIPLFTIGFGDKHDILTLTKLADLSGGKYFPAADQKALVSVFDSINAKLGNTFKAVYKRPEKITNGDVPVLNLVVDTSGSMNLSPEEEGCGYRMQKVQNMFSAFVKNLPQNTLVQISDFDSKNRVQQMITSNKAEMLSAIGQLDAGGGTEIHYAVKSAFNTLKAIPSTRKAIVFMTDAAIDIKDKKGFDKLLSDIKENNIKILWTGLGVDEDEAAFRDAAEKSGGNYVISEDPDILTKSLNQLLDEVKELPASSRTNIRVTVKKRSDTGELFTYSGGQLVEFSPPPNAKERTIPDTVRVEAGPTFSQYDSEMAALVYGSCTPSTETRIMKRIPLSVSGQNTALCWEVHEAIYAERLRGLDAPKNMRFLGLHLTLTNIMPEQEVVVYPDGNGHPSSWISGSSQGVIKKATVPYLIKDIASHIFINLNNSSQSPASPVTWLAENPLAAPGHRELFIQPDKPFSGVIFFIVPDEVTDQMSLHLYDTAWGHIDTPLIGIMDMKHSKVSALPTTVTGKLSDAFSLNVEGLSKSKDVAGISSENTGSFITLEGTISSRVQALLNINPSESFLMSFPTDKGNFMTSLHPTSAMLPYGFTQKTVLAPGSFNKVRMVFEVPKPLIDNPMTLFGDMRDQDLSIKLSGSVPSVPGTGEYKGNGMSLTVNGIYQADKVAGASSRFIVADITVFDEKDGLATRGISKILRLEKSGADPVSVNKATEAMLLGLGSEAIIYDGTSRRGLIAFQIDGKDGWKLVSDAFPSLSISADAKSKLSNDWTIQATKTDASDTWTAAYKSTIAGAVRKYEDMLAVNASTINVQETDENGSLIEKDVPVPPITLTGKERLADIQTVAELEAVLKKLNWLPGKKPFNVRYSPEAVLTQGWGTQGDLALLAEKALSRLGYSPKHRTITLTSKGQTALENRYGIKGPSTVPGLSYIGSDGKSKLLVLPFGQELETLGGLAYMQPSSKEEAFTYETIKVTISMEAVPKDGSAAGQIGSMGGALSGGSGKAGAQTIKVLETTLNLTDTSCDSVDLGFTLVGGKELAVFLDAGNGIIPGSKQLDVTQYDFTGFQTEFAPQSGSKATHHFTYEKGEAPENVYVTYGINLPDIPEEAAVSLTKNASALKEKNSTANDLSALKWYTRSILNKFVAGQTRFEKEFSQKLDIKTGRVNTPRILALTVQHEGERLKTGLDLLKSEADVLSGAKEAATGFLAMSGMLSTSLEATVLPGDGYGLFEIWEKLPAGTSYVLLSPTERLKSEKDFLKAGMPDEIVERLMAIDKETFVLIPDHPAQINGRDRWAWLEMQKSGKTIGVLDTGANGGMVEISIEEWVTEANMFIVGTLVGVSTSLWAVSSFSLELSDTQAIYQKAYQYASGIKDLLEFKAGPVNYGIGGVPEIGGSHNGLKVTFGTDGITLGQDILGFANGYEAGVNYYFGIK